MVCRSPPRPRFPPMADNAASNFADNFGGRIKQGPGEWKFVYGGGLNLDVANNGSSWDVFGSQEHRTIHGNPDFGPNCYAVMLVVNQFASPNHWRVGGIRRWLDERRTFEFQPPWWQGLATEFLNPQLCVRDAQGRLPRGLHSG